jgi:hypothetical protein
LQGTIHKKEGNDSRNRGVDGGITCHTDTLKGRSKHKRPFSPEDGQLNGEHGHDRADDSGQVNVDVLTVSLRNRDIIREVSSLKNDRQERTGNVERPKVSDVGDPEDQSGEGHDLIQ